MQAMNEQTIERLKELQVLDTRLLTLRERKASLSKQADEHRRGVAALEAQSSAKSAELKNGEKAIHLKELDMKGLQEKINRLEIQTNSVKTQKEFNALRHEISALKSDRSRREDDALALMERADALREEMAKLKRAIEAATDAVRREEAAVADDVKAIEAALAEAQSQRQSLAGQIDRDALGKYERILKSRGGQAVAAVVGGTCQGCHMGVTMQTVSRLWSKKELILCGNCSRILYLEGDAT